MLKPYILASLFTVLVTAPSLAQAPNVYASDGTYLGTQSSNNFDPNSQSNQFGPYGSPYSPTSVNNPFSEYGSPYSPDSANNPYATSQPPRYRSDSWEN